MKNEYEVISVGLAGNVVSTVGKGAVSGTKKLAKGAGKVAGNTLDVAGKEMSSVGNAVNKGASKIGTKDRGAQAESMMQRVMKEVDTTGKTSDGYGY